jgi:hypothetical protein
MMTSQMSKLPYPLQHQVQQLLLALLLDAIASAMNVIESAGGTEGKEVGVIKYQGSGNQTASVVVMLEHRPQP